MTLALDERGWVDAQISADGRALLPVCRERSVEQVLQYVEGALVDVQAGDRLAAAVQSPVEATRAYRTMSRPAVMLWLGETLLRAARVARLELGAAGEPAQTGTRLKLQGAGQIEAHEQNSDDTKRSAG